MFTLPWQVEYYTICSSDRDTLRVDEMPSKFVDVKRYPGSGRFWRGSEIEIKLWEEAKARAAEKEKSRKEGKTEKTTKTQTQTTKAKAKTKAKLADTGSAHDDDVADFVIDNVKLKDLHRFERHDMDENDECEPAEPNAPHESQDLELEQLNDIDLLWDSLQFMGESDDEAPAADHSKDEDLLPFGELFGNYLKEFAGNDTDWQDHEEEAAINISLDGIPPEPVAPPCAAPYDPDADQDQEKAQRKDRKLEAEQRKAKIPEIPFILPDGLGELRYNTVSQFMRAHCPYHDKCTRQRQTTPGRHGAGRPIGALISWLEKGATLKDKARHMAVPTPFFSERCKARDKFNTWRRSEEFAAYERPKYSVETGDEPKQIP